MCADIHDGPEQTRSIQGPDTEAQDEPLQIIISSLQRTAGPYKSAISGHSVSLSTGRPMIALLPGRPRARQHSRGDQARHRVHRAIREERVKLGGSLDRIAIKKAIRRQVGRAPRRRRVGGPGIEDCN